MEQRRVVYRNLKVLGKYGKECFVWSVALVEGSRGRGKVQGYIVGKDWAHAVDGKNILGSEITLVDQQAVCTGSLDAIERTGQRAVAAYNCGAISNDVPNGTQREFTMNPLPVSKGGRADKVFYYADEKTTPVNWDGVKAVTFNSKGAFLIR